MICVTGDVAHRPEGTVNPKLATGEIELRARHLEILNRSADARRSSPTATDLPGEDLRLKYRYIDLRRPRDAADADAAASHGQADARLLRRACFIEVETPMLGRSTPEGARDYLVPSRIQHGMFYALPQSPQLYKQILMVAGYDRYVQVARCFRDEDLRADRQPEFTQLDVEMSFIDGRRHHGPDRRPGGPAGQGDSRAGLKLPLPRMTYDEAMERFGHDAPDLRFGMELVDITDLAAECEFRVFRDAADGGRTRARHQCQGGGRPYSRKAIDELTDFVIEDFGAKGLAWFKVEGTASWPRRSPRISRPSCWPRSPSVWTPQPGDLLLLRGRHVRGDLQGPVRPAEAAGGGVEAVRSAPR